MESKPGSRIPTWSLLQVLTVLPSVKDCDKDVESNKTFSSQESFGHVIKISCQKKAN